MIFFCGAKSIAAALAFAAPAEIRLIGKNIFFLRVILSAKPEFR